MRGAVPASGSPVAPRDGVPGGPDCDPPVLPCIWADRHHAVRVIARGARLTFRHSRPGSGTPAGRSRCQAIPGPQDFDYIITGPGTTGCVLASRRNENPDTPVLVLQVAGRGRNLLFHWLAGLARMANGYRWEAQKTLAAGGAQFRSDFHVIKESECRGHRIPRRFQPRQSGLGHWEFGYYEWRIADHLLERLIRNRRTSDSWRYARACAPAYPKPGVRVRDIVESSGQKYGWRRH